MSILETDLHLADEHFRLAVEACPLGMVMVAEDGHIVMVNTATERMFGYARDELTGQPVEILVPSNSRVAHAQYRERFTTHRKAMGRELVARRKDGTEFPVEISLK